MFKCNKCGKEFETKQSLGGHKSSHSRGSSYKKSRETKSSKLRKENSIRDKVCKYCGKEFEKYQSLGGHINRCKLNPEAEKIIHKISIKKIGKTVSDKTKSKISKSMKTAHSEGRAWNIGMSRWNNKQSYPEKFFTKVIENHFDDTNYVFEYPIGKYSFDFAWIDKKLAIEIDGEQHYRFEDYKNRDLKKDKLATELGWKILRIRWKYMYNDTKKYIELSKQFIDNSPEA